MIVQERLFFVDIFKTIAIFAIVLGHLSFLEEDFEAFLFSWHVPVFFFMSGFLHREYGSKKKILFGLARNYIFYWVFCLVLWVPIQLYKFGGIEGGVFEQVFYGFFLGVGSKEYMPQSQPLWFFWALFWVVLLYSFLVGFSLKWRAFIGLAVSAFLVFMIINMDISYGYFGFLQGGVALGFYTVGAYLASKRYMFEKISSRVRRVWAVVGLVLCVSLYYSFASSSGKCDMNSLNFLGCDYYFINSWIGIFLLLFVSWILADFLKPIRKGIEWISTNTLSIFPLHVVFFSYISGVMSVMGIRGDVTEDSTRIFFLFTYSVGAMCLSIFFVSVVGKVWLWIKKGNVYCL